MKEPLAETYSEPCQISKMELFFAKIVNAFQPLTISTKNSILDIWQSYKYASDWHNIAKKQKLTVTIF